MLPIPPSTAAVNAVIPGGTHRELHLLEGEGE